MMTDDAEEAVQIIGDFDDERIVIVGCLHRLSKHAGAGVATQARAAALLLAIEGAWPKSAADSLLDSLYEEARDRERESEANARDERCSWQARWIRRR